ncbi:MAG TPA: hypothetical protein VFW94_19960 [Candidatus Acidoferrales bacterium]|nr:hypothetical protein [Candidatus Acidoferrales bacterium]
MKDLVDRIAEAVLYEGYILYPYRPSALKNRQRWNFGALCPRSYSEAQDGNELWSSKTQCLAIASDSATVDVKVCFLHLVKRRAARVTRTVADLCECTDADFEFVEVLEVGCDRRYTWQEAIGREFEFQHIAGAYASEEKHFEFQLNALESVEPVRGPAGEIAGAFTREQNAIDGSARVQIEKVRDSLLRITLHISNETDFPAAFRASRDEAMMHSLVSCHAVLKIQNGEFVSLLDPPEQFADFASACENVGAYPVLVGEKGQRSTMLSSPVILYDYPKIAPESAGDLFDGTEIDEILTLRILALSEREKTEMRQCDERARRILDRIEANPRHLSQLHGTIRAVD